MPIFIIDVGWNRLYFLSSRGADMLLELEERRRYAIRVYYYIIKEFNFQTFTSPVIRVY